VRFVRLSLRQAQFNLVAYTRSARTVIFGVLMPVGFLALFNSVLGGKTKTIPVDGHYISSIAFYTGGLTTYGVMLGTFTGILVAIVGAREAGWLKRFRGTPMPSGVFLTGEILYLFVTSLGLIIVMLAVSHFGYHLSLMTQAYFAIFCYTVLGVFTFSAMGLALTRVIVTSEMAGSVGPFTVVILSFVSGVFLAPNLLPQWLLTFSSYLPLEPIVSGMQHAIAVSGGSGLQVRPFVVLGVWGAISFAIATRNFTWEPQRGK
jgi:ABC-2 type transport system permease protein